MRSFLEFADTYDTWTDQEDEIATDIRAILDQCPGEIRSRQLEQVAHNVPEFRRQAVQLRKDWLL
jgi:hypothetical protein